MAGYVANEKSCNPFSINIFSAGDEERCLGPVVVGDGEDSVIVSGLREFSDEVHCDYLEGEGPCHWKDRVQGCFGRASVDLVSLTFHTSSDILYDILPELWPPMGPLY